MEAPSLKTQAVITELRNDCTTKSTKQMYASALPPYEAACKRIGASPWPISLQNLETFTAYTKTSNTYANPGLYFWAMVEKARTLPEPLALETKWLETVTDSMERGLEEEEQTKPLTVPVMRQLAAVVGSDTDFNLLLSHLLPGPSGLPGSHHLRQHGGRGAGPHLRWHDGPEGCQAPVHPGPSVRAPATTGPGE